MNPPKKVYPTWEESQATQRARVEQELASWRGSDVNKLIAHFGPPTSTYAMPNGDAMYTFFVSRTLPGLGFNFECARNYLVNKSSNLITNTSYQGCVLPF